MSFKKDQIVVVLDGAENDRDEAKRELTIGQVTRVDIFHGKSVFEVFIRRPDGGELIVAHAEAFAQYRLG